jgi:microsomal dipeptidase-like Zn-dependent dipeptidase
MIFLINLVLTALVCFGSGMDLHNHLFIDQGVPTWFYDGCFKCPLGAKNAESLIGSKANEETLIKSDLDLVVVSLYAHARGKYSLKDAIRKQIETAKDFVSRNPNWVIARNARIARRALQSGKRVLVLSLEGADGILDDQPAIEEFLLDGDIAIVTPLHLVDDEFGGAAFLREFHGLLNFLPYVKSLIKWNPTKIENVRINSQGLTERGDWLIEKLIATKTWIDLAHASDKAQMKIISAMARARQPLLYTHTVLREFHGAERGIAQWQIAEIASKDGMVGLLPSRNYLVNTHGEGEDCATCEKSCHDGLYSFAVQYLKLAKALGPERITMGSDFNAPINHLEKGCSTGNSSETEGFWNLSQTKDLWPSVEKVSQSGPINPRAQLDKFLELWGRVR